jgi:hypothetical protein
LNCIAFTFLSSSQNAEIPEECNKDPKPFQLVYGTRECENISSARSRSDFIMQNYSMKK